ncbi:MAG: SpoIIIAH-like family protein [Clostridia bacterium]|nr:SpoIIIAH-like family protein [Clostridia bacterium]MBQ7363941.1 SpoIIIAH-like family protein [Clostridia bacterium]
MKNEKAKKFFSSRATKSLAVLLAVVLIGVAVYANYRIFYDPTGAMGYGDNNMDDGTGDTSATGGAADEGEDYFSLTVLNRQQSRDEAIDVLKLVSESDEATEEAKAEASDKLAQIALDIQNEANIETLVKAKGFTDCVAVISEDSVSVIVGAEELQAAEAAQIFAIVYETTGISPENISIINK